MEKVPAAAPSTSGDKVVDSKEELISLRIVQLATEKNGTLTNEDLQVQRDLSNCGNKFT